jgi:O-antigen/teichoic acid export membrane protein
MPPTGREAMRDGPVQTTQEGYTVAQEIRTVVRHTAVYGMGAVLAKALGFFLLPVYTHYLSPPDYGLLEVLDVTMSLAGMVLNMGMSVAMLRYYGAAGSPEQKRLVVSTALWFVTITGVLMLLAAPLLAGRLTVLLFGAGMPSRYLLVSFWSFALAFMANLPRAYMRALEASGVIVTLETAGLFLLLVLNVFFLAVLRMGVISMLLGPLIVNILWMPATAWTLRRVGAGWNTPLLRRMLGFGLPLVFSNLAIFVVNFSDRYFLQRLGSLEAVGIYSTGYKFGFLVNFLLVQPFFFMWQVRMYIVHAQPGYAGIFRRIFQMYAAVLLLAGLGLCLFSAEIVHTMVNVRFAGAIGVVPPVVLGYVLYGLGSYLQLGMFLTRRTGAVAAVGAASAVLNLALNYLLIARFGMLGAAWATAVSFLAIAAGSWWCSQRLLPLDLGVGRVLLAGAAAIALYLPAVWLNGAPPAAAAGIKALLFCALPVVLWKCGLLSEHELAAAVSLFRGLRRRWSNPDCLAARKGSA